MVFLAKKKIIFSSSDIPEWFKILNYTLNTWDIGSEVYLQGELTFWHLFKLASSNTQSQQGFGHEESDRETVDHVSKKNKGKNKGKDNNACQVGFPFFLTFILHFVFFGGWGTLTVSDQGLESDEGLKNKTPIKPEAKTALLDQIWPIFGVTMSDGCQWQMLL